MQTFSHTDFTLCNMQLSHKQILQNIMVIAIGKRKKIDFHENKLHNFIENILSFYATFFTRGFYRF